MPKLLLSLLAVIVGLGVTSADAAMVKLSKSGICHAPGTGWYDRTQSFTPYDTLEDCLSVGRLPKGDGPTAAQLPAPRSSIPAYDRDRYFGSWIDADGDCLNTRHETLAALSTGPVTYGSSRCYIQRGRWNDPYTGRIFTEAKDVDIDHMVPLKWAWEHGASAWTQEKRVGFANDPMNLFIVDAPSNRQKGADGPLEWLPPNQGYHCEYVLRFQRIALTYDLSFTDREAQEYAALRSKVCGR